MNHHAPLPPHDSDAEQALLGSLLIDPQAIPNVIPCLQPDDFYIHKHRQVYEAVVALHDRADPVDFVTLCDELERREALANVGGSAALTDLINHVPSAVHAQGYARIVARTALRRRMLTTASSLAQLAYDLAIPEEEALDQIEASLLALRRDGHDRLHHLSFYLHELYDQAQQELATPISTPFPSLNQLLHGLHPSDLVVVAARTGFGKSSFLSSLALDAAQHHHPVALFSLEMSGLQIAQRLTAMQSGLTLHDLRTGRLDSDDWSLLVEASGQLSLAPIWIDDSPAISLLNIRSKARRLMAQHGIHLLVVDYLQLVSAPGRHETRNLEVGTITRGLKSLARELDIPILVASQLSRAVEHRSDQRPRLSDLRESGSIEMDADVVIFIHRDDLDAPLAHLIVAKQRNGPTGQVPIAWRPQSAHFSPLARTQEVPQ